jgi:hypothetical protein
MEKCLHLLYRIPTFPDGSSVDTVEIDEIFSVMFTTDGKRLRCCVLVVCGPVL